VRQARAIGLATSLPMRVVASAFGGARRLSLAGLVQRRVRELIDLVAVSLGLAVAHEDEAFRFGAKLCLRGVRRDPLIAEEVDDLGHGSVFLLRCERSEPRRMAQTQAPPPSRRIRLRRMRASG
jgi:hypothetical protein